MPIESPDDMTPVMGMQSQSVSDTAQAPAVGNVQPSYDEGMTLEELIEKTSATVPEKLRGDYKNAFLRHSDYTKKTQSHADAVREWEAQKQQLENESNFLRALLEKDPSLINRLNEQSEDNEEQPNQNVGLMQMLSGLSDEDKMQVAQMLAPQIVPYLDKYGELKGSMNEFNEKYAEKLSPDQLAEYYNLVASGVSPQKARYAVMGEGFEKQLAERDEALKKITGGYSSDVNAAKSEPARPPITDKAQYLKDLAREYDTKAVHQNALEG